MREIKFRVWNKKTKLYFEYWVGNSCDSLNEIFERDDYIFEQYTGLKDKKGKKIFEGDIVEDAAGRAFIVRYLNHKATFVFEWIKDRRQYQTFSRFNNAQKPLEIIGNIHE
jgi:uncharacterized phage protein (TIGR01671 family)